MLLLLTLLTVSASYAQKHTCTAKSLNVRIAPNKDAKAVGSLTKGQVVDVVETKGAWATIEYAGREAYVAAKFLKKGGKATATQQETTSQEESQSITKLKVFATEQWQLILMVLGACIAALFTFKLIRKNRTNTISPTTTKERTSSAPAAKTRPTTASAPPQKNTTKKKDSEAEDEWKEVEF